jgi:hypothetical protein
MRVIRFACPYIEISPRIGDTKPLPIFAFLSGFTRGDCGQSRGCAVLLVTEKLQACHIHGASVWRVSSLPSPSAPTKKPAGLVDPVNQEIVDLEEWTQTMRSKLNSLDKMKRGLKELEDRIKSCKSCKRSMSEIADADERVVERVEGVPKRRKCVNTEIEERVMFVETRYYIEF